MKKNDFIEKAVAKFGNKYDYSLLPDKFLYKDKIPIICPKHGKFWRIASLFLLQGYDCPKCKQDNKIIDLDGELWMPIKNYQHYFISNKARVKIESFDKYYKDGRIRHNIERLITQTNKEGYMVVRLFNGQNKKGRLEKVHRLVATAFIPNPDNKPYIDHINTIRNDNRIENLRWVTHTENMRNPISVKRQSNIRKRYILEYDIKNGGGDNSYRKRISNIIKEKYKNDKEYRKKILSYNKCRRKRVFHYDENGIFIDSFLSAREAAEYYGCGEGCISSWCLKKHTPKNKHIWRYE